MTARALTLTHSLKRFAVSWRRRILALCGARAGWFVILASVLMIYMDVVAQLSSGIRLTLDGVALSVTAAAAVYTYARHTRARSRTRLVARLMETGDPSLRNDLINAIEFEQVLADGAPLVVSRSLMQHEVSIASGRTAQLERIRSLTPPSLGKELLYVLAGLTGAALLAFVFPNVSRSVVPRYLDPYGDHPPYSPTRLTLAPAGITVDYGDSVGIRVVAEGAQPDDVTLVLEDRNGRPIGELPMLKSSEGNYRQAIDHATRDLVYYARIDRGRSKRQILSINKAPRIGAVDVSYEYPAYTKLQPRTRQLGGDATIRAYEGTRVSLAIASNRPLRGGTIRVGREQFPLTVNHDPSGVTGTLTIERPARIEITIVDIEDNSSKQPLSAAIAVVEDKAPTIAIVSPDRQAFAIPSAKIPIEIEAKDDLGIANITIFRRLNESGDLPKSLFASDGGETQARAVEVLDLADLGVRPGDIIDFYAAATDTYPKAPHTEATPSHQIAIISEDQYRAFLQQQTTAANLKDQYEEFNEQIGSLKKAQEEIQEQTKALQNKVANGVPLAPEDTQKIKDLSGRQKELAQQTQDAAEALRQKAAALAIFDIESEFRTSLQEMAERLERARDAMNKSGSALDDAAGAGLTGPIQSLSSAETQQRNALKELGQNNQQFAENVGKPLDTVERMYKLLEDAETFKAIYSAQVDMERQARAYDDVTVPSLDRQVRLKELGGAQNEIRHAMITLRNDFERHAAEIEAELPTVSQDAREIVNGIDKRNIPGVMEQAASALAAGNGVTGHLAAEEAAHLLDQMIQRVQEVENTGMGEERLTIAMGTNPHNTMKQLKRSVRPTFSQGRQPGSEHGSGQSANSFDMFGPQGNQTKPGNESVLSYKKATASADAVRHQTEFAGAFEELDGNNNRGLSADGLAAEPVVEQYRSLIDAYFERVAEEKK